MNKFTKLTIITSMILILTTQESPATPPGNKIINCSLHGSGHIGFITTFVSNTSNYKTLCFNKFKDDSQTQSTSHKSLHAIVESNSIDPTNPECFSGHRHVVDI